MSTFLTLIHQAGFYAVIPANSTSSAIHANWMENLVFALAFILGAAFVLQGAWNGLLAEFPQIGRMSYYRAVHMTAVLGVALWMMWLIFC